MEFILRFRGAKGLYILPVRDGLTWYDKVCAELLRTKRIDNKYELSPTEIFGSKTATIASTFDIPISVETARNIGGFGTSTIRYVDVSGSYSFTKYLSQELQDDDNARVHPPEKLPRFRFKYKLDSDKIYADWKAAGYPSDWRIS